MYFHAHDLRSGLLVAIAAGDQSTADHVATMDALAKLDRACKSLRGPLVTLLTIEPSASLPTPKMRQDYAEQQARMLAPRHLFLLITASRAVRGVMTAVNWLRPPDPSFRTDAFATFDEAAVFAEKERGEPLPQLHTLLTEVQRQRSLALPPMRAAR